MTSAEAVRYDRQIRLWGKSTQQQLMRTCVEMHGIAGAAAEAAKNLSLAGVRELAVVDDGVVSADEARTTYLMQGQEGVTRGLRSLGSLRRLNPHVRVHDGAVELQEESGAKVAIVAVDSLQDATPHLCAGAAPLDILVLHVRCGATVLSFFLYRRLSTHKLEEQWRRLVAEPSLLAEKPRAYQKAVLSLHMRRAPLLTNFAAAAVRAYELVGSLHLQLLTAKDVEDVVQCYVHGAAATDCVTDTVAGACIAQHLIQQIGALHEPSGEQAYRWMLCVCDDVVECLVGV